MRNSSYSDEAEACRRQAAQFAGQPEGNFLLRVARSFEELEAAPSVRIDSDSSGEPRRAQLGPDSRGRQ
jgi:hypothetical protein